MQIFERIQATTPCTSYEIVVSQIGSNRVCADVHNGAVNKIARLGPFPPATTLPRPGAGDTYIAEAKSAARQYIEDKDGPIVIWVNLPHL